VGKAVGNDDPGRGSQPLSASSVGRDFLPGKRFGDDAFGFAIAVGDVTGDGYDDLTVTSAEGYPAPGTIHLFPGSPFGVDATKDSVLQTGAVIDPPGGLMGSVTLAVADFWSQRSFHIKGIPIRDDSFSSGFIRILNFGKGSQPDLAVHSTEDHLKGRGTPLNGVGAVNVLYSSARGVTRADQLWHQNSPGIVGRARGRASGDSFGGYCC
jgi:hypothetical protein